MAGLTSISTIPGRVAGAGEFNAIQPDPKRFPDIKGLADQIHGLGLKIGIYSTPWVTSYAGHVGGSSVSADGSWNPAELPKKSPFHKDILPYAVGQYHFAIQDAKQWALWGIDYLKYDWGPIDAGPTRKCMTLCVPAAGMSCSACQQRDQHTF